MADGGDVLRKRDPETGKKMIDPIDIHVGGRLRKRRRLLGLSQTQVGSHLGVTFQQVQKYEKGTNRIGAGRLFRLAEFLDVDVMYFFEKAEYASEPAQEALSFSKLIELEETRELVHIYYAIVDLRVRRKIIAIAQLLN